MWLKPILDGICLTDEDKHVHRAINAHYLPNLHIMMLWYLHLCRAWQSQQTEYCVTCCMNAVLMCNIVVCSGALQHRAGLPAAASRGYCGLGRGLLHPAGPGAERAGRRGCHPGLRAQDGCWQELPPADRLQVSSALILSLRHEPAMVQSRLAAM